MKRPLKELREDPKYRLPKALREPSHESLREYVGHVVDTALWGGRLSEYPRIDLLRATLVGWQCGFEPMVVAVVDCYTGGPIDEDEAVELATDYLAEIEWFGDVSTRPDYVVLPNEKRKDAK